jgi:F-type H+-transporting ATPase subunit delta
MAELNTLARPYAKAAFQQASESGDLAAWATQIATLAAVAQTKNVSMIINSPSIPSEKKVQILIDVCGEELGDKAHNFVTILAENKRLGLLPQIQQLFEQLKANQERTVNVEISTAFELDSEAQEKLNNVLSKKLEREIRVNTIVDKTLLGGILVRAGDIVIDGSVRGRLEKLAESMNL